MIWIGSKQQLAKVHIKEFQLLSANILFSTTVSNLGVHLDSQLTMQDHVAAMCCSCFFQLRQLRTARPCIDGTEVSASGLKIGRSPVQISPKTNFSIMTKLPVKSIGK